MRDMRAEEDTAIIRDESLRRSMEQSDPHFVYDRKARGTLACWENYDPSPETKKVMNALLCPALCTHVAKAERKTSGR